MTPSDSRNGSAGKGRPPPARTHLTTDAVTRSPDIFRNLSACIHEATRGTRFMHV